MPNRTTLEFVAGLVAAGVVTAGLATAVQLPYALAVGLAVGTPGLVRTSMRVNRTTYEAAKSSTGQVVDAVLAAGATAGVGLVGGYLALSNGFTGPFAAAVAAAVGVFAGQITFYVRIREYLE